VGVDEMARPGPAIRVLLRYLAVDRRLLPVLILSFLSSFTLSLRVDFMGIWALDHLGAAAAALGSPTSSTRRSRLRRAWRRVGWWRCAAGAACWSDPH
jgi:hypothetical protein